MLILLEFQHSNLIVNITKEKLIFIVINNYILKLIYIYKRI